MTKVTYTGPAGVWRTRAYGGVAVSAGETIDIDDETAQALVDNEDFEHADAVADSGDESGSEPEHDVLSGSVDDLEEAVDAGDHDGHLADLKRDEEQHKDRSTAKEAIDERRRELAEAESDESGS